MSAPPELTRDGRVPARRRAGWAVLALVLACSGTLVLSAAAFSGTASSTGNGLAAGTLDIATAPTSAAISRSSLAPGDTTVAPLLVTNSASLALRYVATTTSTEDVLAPALQLTVREGVSDCSVSGFGADGTPVTAATSFASTAGVAVFGDPSTGADPGDRVLAAGASEELCLRVELPSGLDEATYANRSTTVTLRLDAEQTANNP